MEEARKILDLVEGLNGVTVKGRVIEVTEPRIVETRRGMARLSTAVIGDETGRITLTLWGDHAGTLKPGEVIIVDGGWTTSYRGYVQLNAGRRTRIEKVEEHEAPEASEIPEETPKAKNPDWRRGFGGGFGRRTGGQRARRGRW